MSDNRVKESSASFKVVKKNKNKNFFTKKYFIYIFNLRFH